MLSEDEGWKTTLGVGSRSAGSAWLQASAAAIRTTPGRRERGRDIGLPPFGDGWPYKLYTTAATRVFLAA
jgi:hypothetical protein